MAQGNCWYADCSMFVVRPHCMDSKNGYPPFQWLGRNVKLNSGRKMYRCARGKLGDREGEV